MGLINSEGGHATMGIVDKFKGRTISDKIGKVKINPIKLEYERGFKPIQL